MKQTDMCLLTLLLLVAYQLFAAANANHFFLHPQSKNVVEGSNVTLICGTTSVINCQEGKGIEWKRYIQRLDSVTKCATVEPNLESERRMTVELDFENGTYRLDINNVRIEDGGEYWCYLFYDDTANYKSNRARLAVEPNQPRFSSKSHSTEPPRSTKSMQGGTTMDNLSVFNLTETDELPSTDSSTQETDILSTGSASLTQISEETNTTSTVRQSVYIQPDHSTIFNTRRDPGDHVTTNTNPSPAETVTSTRTAKSNEDSRLVQESHISTAPTNFPSPNMTQPSTTNEKHANPHDDNGSNGFQQYLLWVIVGCSLSLAVLLIASVSCAQIIAIKTRRVKRSSKSEEEEVRNPTADEETAISSVLIVNPIYEGLAQDTGNQPDPQDATLTPPDEAGQEVLWVQTTNSSENF